MKKAAASGRRSVVGRRSKRTAGDGELPASIPARPFVFLNMAMSADGKIASANRVITTFGSKRDLEHLYELRATADAIMAGARTIEETGATLGPGGRRYQRLRRQRGLAEFPLRVIVSGSGSIDPQAAIFQHTFSPIVVLTTGRAPAARLRGFLHHADAVACGRRAIHFLGALQYLRAEWNVKRLLCEGGGELNDALFRAGLVDELHLTICPRIFGGSQAPTLADGLGFPQLANAAGFRLQKAARVGDELFLVYRAIRRDRGESR